MILRRATIVTAIFCLALSLSAPRSLSAAPKEKNNDLLRRCPPHLAASEIPPSPFANLLLDNVVDDGGFEQGAGSGAWQDSSTNFGTPICNPNLCGGGGNFGPHQGNWWCWFGGIDTADETGIVSQNIRIPFAADTLSFWFWIPTSRTPGTFRVEMDGNTLFLATEADSQFSAGYTEVKLDISAYADTMLHELKFTGSTTAGDITNFFLDDVFIDDGQGPTGIEPVSGLPADFQLQQNYPNPFNPVTTLEFTVPPSRMHTAERITLRIFDVLGREIATLVDGPLPPGRHSVQWDGRSNGGIEAASGIYLYQLMAGGRLVQTRKMMLIR